MNYLAHAYLTGTRGDLVLMGNLMGDFVKGNKYLQYEFEVQQGILLHRNIDTFVDAHPLLSEAKQLLRPHYGLYSGALLDVLWDHFLANDRAVFSSEQTLLDYTQHIYAVMDKNKALMSEKMSHICGYMVQYDWLANYRKIEGLHSSWRGMSKRIEHLPSADEVVAITKNNYEYYGSVYHTIIADMRKQFL
jgi:acyl carrier protein phosphodiesterase